MTALQYQVVTSLLPEGGDCAEKKSGGTYTGRHREILAQAGSYRGAEQSEAVTPELFSDAQQAQENLRRNEGVAAGGVAIVRRSRQTDRTARLKEKLAARAGIQKGAVLFEVERQVHRVERPVLQLPGRSGVRRAQPRVADVVPDVMAYDHAVTKIRETLDAPAARPGRREASSRVMPCTVTDELL